MQSRFNQMHLDAISMRNSDAIVTESEMHIITSKLDENINQKPDQQIKLDQN